MCGVWACVWVAQGVTLRYFSIFLAFSFVFRANGLIWISEQYAVECTSPTTCRWRLQPTIIPFLALMICSNIVHYVYANQQSICHTIHSVSSIHFIILWWWILNCAPFFSISWVSERRLPPKQSFSFSLPLEIIIPDWVSIWIELMSSTFE